MNEELEDLIHKADLGLITPTGRRPYRNSIDLTGKSFGMLSVLRRLPNTQSNSRWLCQCTCGELVAVTGGNLRSGGSQSCGCVRYRSGSESWAWKGCGDLTGRQWSGIRANARARGHDFAMTVADGWELHQRQEGRCALTGWALVINAPVFTDVTASLDRIDSSMGYTVDNTQWVHKDVNIAKSVFSQRYFISMCSAVASTHVLQ